MLVAYYRLDEDNGTNIVDSQGSNDGTWTGTDILTNGSFATWTAVATPDDVPTGWTENPDADNNDASNHTTEANSAGVPTDGGGHCRLLSDGTLVELSQTVLTVGKTYTASINVTADAAGSLSFVNDSQVSPSIDGVSVQTWTFTATGTSFFIRRRNAEATDLTFKDVSVREHVDPQPSPVGKGLLFDGTGDFISIPDAAIWDDTTLSITQWVKPDIDFVAGATGYLCTRNTTGASSWGIFVGTNLKLGYKGGGGGFINSVSAIPAGQWTHIAIVFNGTNGKLYINGVEDRSATVTAVGTSDIQPIIGSRWDTKNVDTTLPFNGSISDVRIYDHALSQGEIANLAQSKNRRSRRIPR